MLVRALWMSNERRYECLLQEQAATEGTTNCPKTYEHADLRTCRTQQNECLKPAHVLASGSGLCNKKKEKLCGLTTGMNLSDYPAKFCTNPGISAVLTLTVCTRCNCGLLASLDQLTLLACNAKKAPMSISVSLSLEERRLGLCLFPPMIQLGFRSALVAFAVFLTLEPCPCCCCHVLCCCLDHDLCLWPVRLFWGTLLLASP